MRVSVFGLGYVGSVTAACLANAGHRVVAVDPIAEKVAAVGEGRSPVAEPGLAALIAEQVAAGRLTATTSSAEAIAASDLALICVGTPSRGAGQQDLGALQRVLEQLDQGLRRRSGSFTVVVRSTVLPGTTEKLLGPLVAAHRGRLLISPAVNPEFMREGTAISDFCAPPFVLVGCQGQLAGASVRALYAGLDAPFLATTITTAEMVKFATNAFHAMKICFANEVAELCGALGADGCEVMRIFALDRKLSVSASYLRPGFAFGGSCLPKDVRALTSAARAADLETPLLASILPSNEVQLRRGLAAVLAAGKRRVGVLGLAFKPGTDDIRESPLLALVETLIGKGFEVRVFDRHLALANLVGANRRQLLEKIPHIASLLTRSLRQLQRHAEVLVIGHGGQDARRLLASAQPQQLVIDLTREPTNQVPRGRAAVSLAAN
jgi:GDP-mannose 6-dehydrogenase